MTNFEKYREEIEKLKNKYSFTLDLDGNVVNCNDILCCNCKFQDFVTCKNSKINWLFKEYEESILSDDELELIKNIGRIKNKRYKYVVRMESGAISLFVDKPTVLEDDFGRYCSSKRYFSVLDSEKILFQNIRYEDGIYDIENKTFIK